MYNYNRNEIQVPVGLILIGLSIFVGIMILSSSMYTIYAGERGVLLTWGQPDPVAIGEGLHFKIPIAQKVVKLDIKTTKLEQVADSASKDLQDVQTTIALNYHISAEQVSKLYQEIGLAYEDRIITPVIQESIKSVSAKFTAEELITKRAEVKFGIKELLTNKLLESDIIVDDFNIINFQFSESFDAAIDAKQVAEQKALEAERDLQRIKVEAEQEVTRAQADRQAKILRAEGEAESIRIQSQALLQSKDILELRWIEKWSGEMPTTYITGEQDMLIGISQPQ